MTTTVLILLMAACVYAVRLSGFVLATVTIPARWERTLFYVPIATLAALVVASLAGRNDQTAAGVIAAVVAIGLARLTRRGWACIVGGMLVYWLLLIVT